jgi:hypothetical protein
MIGPATGTDLGSRSLRVLSAHELTVGATLLNDAWGIIVNRVPGIEARFANYPEGETLRALIIQVQTSMVLRVLYNPEGKLSETQDDYSYRLDSATSTGSLYLSDAELALLGAGSVVSEGAYTIKPAGWRC